MTVYIFCLVTSMTGVQAQSSHPIWVPYWTQNLGNYVLATS